MSTTVNINHLAALDTTELLEQIRAMQKQMCDISEITSAAFANDDDLHRWSPSFPKNWGDQPASDRVEITHRTTAPIGAVEIIESDLMTVPAEDWSRVRSPSRARRRMKRGHRQNIRRYLAPDPKLIVRGNQVIGHPVTLRQAMEKMGAEVRDQVERRFLDVLYGRM